MRNFEVDAKSIESRLHGQHGTLLPSLYHLWGTLILYLTITPASVGLRQIAALDSGRALLSVSLGSLGTRNFTGAFNR